MRSGVLAAALGCLLAVAPLAPAQAQEDGPPKIDGEALWRDLRDDPIQTLPDAAARFDERALRAAMRAAEQRLDGDVYVVVAPFRQSPYDVRDALESRLGGADELITVTGVEVTTDWYDFADGEFYGDGPEGRWEDAINVRHAPSVMQTYDVTAPLLDVLRLARDGKVGKPSPPPETTPADKATVDELAAALRQNRTYVDPSLRGDDRHGSTSSDVEQFGSARVLHLPAVEPGKPVPDVLTPLSRRFPRDTVAVVRGVWLEAAGPGSARALRTSLRFARDSQRGAVLWMGPSVSLVDPFFERLKQIRDGVLDPRGVPVRPPSVEDTGVVLGPWAFAGTGVAIGGVTVGGWLWRRSRRRRAEQRAVRIGSAELAADLARLAAAIVAAESQRDGRRRAEAAERYATAVDLTEQAHSSAELDVARDVVRQAHEILAEAR